MKIQFLTDTKGKKKAIVIPIKMYEKMLTLMEE